MTEKPNTQHEIGTIRIPLGNGNIVDIHGPDREANAKLFIRAQHMGELVEALKAWDDAATGKGFWSDAENKRLAILAKIGGGE